MQEGKLTMQTTTTTASVPKTELITRALTIKQPFAWGISTSIKLVENRTWPTNYRGRIAIHASLDEYHLYPSDEMYDSFWSVPAVFAADDVDDGDEFDQSPITPPFTLGAIVGTAEIIGCVELDPIETFESQVRALPGFQEQYGGTPITQFATGPYCFILANAERLLNPIPCRGKLNLWTIPDQVQIALHHSRRKLLTDPQALPNLTEQEKEKHQKFLASNKS